jgi:hypothetical protein
MVEPGYVEDNRENHVGGEVESKPNFEAAIRN